MESAATTAWRPNGRQGIWERNSGRAQDPEARSKAFERRASGLRHRLLPTRDLFPSLRQLVRPDVILQSRTDNFDPVQVSLAEIAGLDAIGEVPDLADIDAHQFGSHAVGGEPVETSHAHLLIAPGRIH